MKYISTFVNFDRITNCRNMANYKIFCKRHINLNEAKGNMSKFTKDT